MTDTSFAWCKCAALRQGKLSLGQLEPATGKGLAIFLLRHSLGAEALKLVANLAKLLRTLFLQKGWEKGG